MLHKLTSRISLLMLGALVLASCRSNETRWIHVIPDGYQGWVAIQYDCDSGIPLDRNNDVIRVAYDDDGLFCTTNSPPNASGVVAVEDASGVEYPYFGNELSGKSGACCKQRITPSWIEDDTKVEEALDLIWVGPMGDGYPPLDLIAINEAARMGGEFVPTDW